MFSLRKMQFFIFLNKNICCAHLMVSELSSTPPFICSSGWNHHQILSIKLTFLRLANLGNPFNDVRPTLMILSDSNTENESVRPSIACDLQLSRFSSLIWNSMKNNN